MLTTATGIVTRAANAPLEVEELLVDDPGPGEVLVRIQANGLCHSDYTLYHGRVPERLPGILGHEAAGIVEQVGTGVQSPRVGDYVVLAWRAPCGRCRFCLRGQLNLCTRTLVAEPRIHTRDGLTPARMLAIGSLCSHVVVSAAQAVPVPDRIAPEYACLVGCAVMTGVGAALYTAAVRAGSSVAVFGCGGVGTSVVQGARLARATKIIAVDLDPRKLEAAVLLGATHTVDASGGDAVEQVKSLTEGQGVDYAFEAVGAPATFRQAVESCAYGGTAVLVGVTRIGDVMDLALEPFFHQRLTLKPSTYGDCVPARDFPLLLDWYERGELKLEELVSRKLSLEQTSEGFEAMARGDVLRSVVLF